MDAVSPDDILTDEQRAAVRPVMGAALAWVVADEKAHIVRAHRRLALTVALALAERDLRWHPDAANLQAECTRLREALGE